MLVFLGDYEIQCPELIGDENLRRCKESPGRPTGKVGRASAFAGLDSPDTIVNLVKSRITPKQTACMNEMVGLWEYSLLIFIIFYDFHCYHF
jgi:hypothetical protein